MFCLIQELSSLCMEKNRLTKRFEFIGKNRVWTYICGRRELHNVTDGGNMSENISGKKSLDFNFPIFMCNEY